MGAWVMSPAADRFDVLGSVYPRTSRPSSSTFVIDTTSPKPWTDSNGSSVRASPSPSVVVPLFRVETTRIAPDQPSDNVVLATEALREAAQEIAKVSGTEIGVEDVLDRLFGDFCIGEDRWLACLRGYCGWTNLGPGSSLSVCREMSRR